MTAGTATATKRQRTCAVCGGKGPKGSLYRIVRTPEGAVCFDGSGRLPGRGAYVCSAACFQKARKTQKISRALKAQLNENDYENIARDLEQALGNVGE